MYSQLKVLGLAGIVSVVASQQFPLARAAPQSELCRGYVAASVQGTVSYAQAQQDESLRQIFLTNLLKSEPHKNISELYYNQEGKLSDRCLEESIAAGVTSEKSRGHNKIFSRRMDMVYTCSTAVFGREIASPLFVNTQAFNLSKDMFLSAMKHHEYFHADDCFRGIDYGDGVRLDKDTIERVSYPVLMSVLESRAYGNQLKHLTSRMRIESGKMSADSQTLLWFQNFLLHSNNLSGIHPKTEFEAEILKRQSVLAVEDLKFIVERIPKAH